MKEIKKKIDELKGISGLKNNDRNFKVGDIVRFTGPGHAISQIEKRGLGVVVSINGPLFQTYWIGDGAVTGADARGGGYKLQDIAPIPQVAEWLENKS
jgi:hypothetical protein